MPATLYCPNFGVDEPVASSRDSRLVTCDRCGLSRIRPRMSRAEAEREMERRYSIPGRFESCSPIVDAPRHNDEVKMMLSCLAGKRERPSVLDVGAGFGGLVHCLSRHGADAVGIDPYPGFVELAKKYGVDVRLGAFELSTLDAELLTRRFDIICFRGSLCYIFDLDNCFRLVERLLKPNGWLYVYMHVLDSAYYLRNRDILSRYGPFASFVPTRTGLRRLLESRDFSVQREYGVVGSGCELLFGLRPRIVGADLDALINPMIAMARMHDAVIYMARWCKQTSVGT